MNLQGFETISTNCDLLIHIYKLLNFGDQLRLAQASKTLKMVFENFIWTEDYRTLIIDKIDTVYVVANATKVNRCLLDTEAFEEFLRFYAAKVQELNIDVPLDLRQFKNLTSLVHGTDYSGMDLIQLVADEQPNLESLQLQSCFLFEDCPEDAQIVENLLKMKNLKRLDLYDAQGAPIKYQHFCEIIFKMQLEVLELNFEVEPDSCEGETGNTTSDNSVTLNELAITTTLDPCKWSDSFPSFLMIFANLSILTIQFPVEDEVTDEILDIIASSCQKLESLCIDKATFTNIESFSIPPTVTELRLNLCHGLTHRNLKDILTATQITKCISHFTEYEGVFEDFPISPLIETLSLHKVDMCKFRSAYEENEHLKNLTWFHSKDCRNANSITTDVPLASCHNLETLSIRHSQMALDTLLHLKHLHNLSTLLMTPIQWSYISGLLRHPSLTELSLKVHSRQAASLDVPVEGFATNVTTLNVNHCVFKCALEFWLDLFCQNVNMKLTVHDLYLLGMDYLRTVINHKKFPKYLKTIDFRGFTLNCTDLRRNFDVTMEEVRNVCYVAGGENSHRLGKVGLILCRK